jgi:hypothetical protein
MSQAGSLPIRVRNVSQLAGRCSKEFHPLSTFCYRFLGVLKHQEVNFTELNDFLLQIALLCWLEFTGKRSLSWIQAAVKANCL